MSRVLDNLLLQSITSNTDLRVYSRQGVGGFLPIFEKYPLFFREGYFHNNNEGKI